MLDEYFSELIAYKAKSHLSKRLRTEIEERFAKEDKSSMKMHGFLLQKKKRRTFSWSDEMYDILEHEDLLANAVSISRSLEKRFDLSGFFTLGESSLRTIVSAGVPEIHLELEELSLSDLVQLYKQASFECSLSETSVEKQKKRLIQHLVESGQTKLSCEQGHVTLTAGTPSYHTERFLNQELFSTRFVFTVKDGKVIDALTKEELVFEDHICMYKQIPVYFNGKDIRVKGDPLKGSRNKFEGIIELTRSEACRFFPLSSTKIEQLIDDGLIDTDALLTRETKSETTFFEIISEETDKARKLMFPTRFTEKEPATTLTEAEDPLDTFSSLSRILDIC